MNEMTAVRSVSAPVSRKMMKPNLDGQKPKILHVDDDWLHCAMTSMLLTNQGFEFQSAGDGKTGVELARAWLPDLILLDVMMPIMDGIQAAEILRADPRTSHIPVITLTAEATDDIRTRLKAAGVREILQKPVLLPQLLQAMQPYLNPDAR